MSKNIDTSTNYASNVRSLYEEYPFPLRDPQDEARRLVIAEQESIGKLNHYCFRGQQAFGNGFRVLVAGGGTGDHTIFLAEQLRNYDASVTYIDISRTSMVASLLDPGCRITGARSVRFNQLHRCSAPPP
jgi:hypothetical protein